MKQPPKYKMAVIIWLAIYPSINLILILFGEPLAAMPLLIRTLILTGILVPLMVFVLIPLLSKAFSKWLIN